MSNAVPQEHPAPHRERVSLLALLFGLAAGPAGWIAQLLLGYGLSSYACYPSDEPQLTSPPRGWSGEHVWLLAINLLCLALTVAGFLTALANWRRTRAEKEGGAHRLLQTGEGRARFLALSGMLACGVFALAILANTWTVLGVPACWDVPR
jgi:hypothetical protein